MNYLERVIELALLEDAAFEDVTAMATIEKNVQGVATITAKAAGVLSGCSVADKVFSRMGVDITCDWHKRDGEAVQAGDCVAQLSGPLRRLLSAERTALNFMQHLSGIASLTQQYVQALEGLDCKVVDTRKTTPCLRLLEKQAVEHGGGGNHRMDLSEAFLIKENHIEGAGSITDAVGLCYQLDDSKWVETECETLEQVLEAIAVSPDIILLDNMSPAMVAQARAMVPTSILLEASGNITLENIHAYARAGVNRVAIGAITHSAPALDLSMRVNSANG